MPIGVETFDRDLEVGKEAELKVLKIIQNKYSRAYKVQGNVKEFDIVIPERNVTVEVKFDLLSEKTGNYYFESQFQGKPSGIKTTMATYWAVVDKKHLIWIATESLKYLIKEFKLVEREFPTFQAKGYLMEIDSLINSPYTQVVTFV